MHVTKIARFDWLAAFSAGVICMISIVCQVCNEDLLHQKFLAQVSLVCVGEGGYK